MPNIREYTSAAVAGRQGLQPNNLGVEATAQAGRRMGVLGDEAGNAVKSIGRDVGQIIDTAGNAYEDFYGKKEVLKSGADSATLSADLMSKWNTTRNTADPNDPTVAQRFNSEVLQPALENFGKGYSTPAGQKMAIDFRQRMLEHFATTQQADERTMSKAAAEQNLVTMQNEGAAALVSDPSGLALHNTNVSSTIDAYKKVGGLTAEDNAQLDGLKKTILRTNTKAAFYGMAQNNPEAAAAALKSGFGADNLTEQDRAELANHADSMQRMRIEQARSDQTWQKQQNQQKGFEAADKLISTAIQPDGTFQANKDYYEGILNISRMPNIAPGLLTSLYSDGVAATRRAEEGTPTFTDPHTYEDFNKRLMLDPTDPNKLEMKDIVDAHTQGRLADKDFSRMVQDYNLLQRDPGKKEALRQFTAFQNSMKSSITKSNIMSGGDAQGDQRWGQWQSVSREAFEQAYTSGQDWHAMLQAGSPNYLGNTATPYMVGSKAGIKEVQTNIKTGVSLVAPPGGGRQKGESADQYLRRIGGG